MGNDEASQPAVLSAIELSSGWDAADVARAREAFAERAARPGAWRGVRAEYCHALAEYAAIWRRCAP